MLRVRCGDGAVRRRPRTTAYPRMRRFTKRPRRIQSTGTKSPSDLRKLCMGRGRAFAGRGPSGRGGCALGRGGGGCAPRRALPDGRRTPKPLIGGNSARNRTNARSRRPWLDRGPRPSLSNQDRSRPGRDRRARTGPGGPRAAARRDPRRTRSGLQWRRFVKKEGRRWREITEVGRRGRPFALRWKRNPWSAVAHHRQRARPDRIIFRFR